MGSEIQRDGQNQDPINSGETPFQERRITIDSQTLIIPASIQEQMATLDAIIRQRPGAAEILGIGLTKRKSDTETEVVEFIGPRPDRIFHIDQFMLWEGQSDLISALCKHQNLKLRITPQKALILALEDGEEYEVMAFDSDSQGDIEWGCVDKNLSSLTGVDLPEHTSGFELMLADKGENEALEIPIDTDWDYITTQMSVNVPGRFFRRIQDRAHEIGAEMGFSMHHHPTIPILKEIHAGVSTAEASRLYDILLSYSTPDVQTMHHFGMDFFEIRAFGDVQHPFDQNFGPVSRFYRVSTILYEDEKTRNKVLGIGE